jgi:hypothetical protein
MALELLLRTSKLFYEKKFLQESGQIFKFLFPTVDIDDTSTVLLDEFTDSPYAVAYRGKDNQAHLRPYQAGSGTLFEPPRASEYTPIDEKLRDQSVEGTRDNASFNEAQMRKTNKILNNHATGHTMTKNKQAIDMILDGAFYAKGITAADLGLDEVYARDVANNLTYDFTAGGATIDEAMTEVLDQIESKGCPMMEVNFLVGKNWQVAFESDSNVLVKMQANAANVLVQQNLKPPVWAGVQGLKLLGIYRPVGSSTAVNIFTYNPGTPYIAYKGATAAPWIGDDVMCAWSGVSPAYTVYRGIDVVASNGNKIDRVSGEIAFDSWIEQNPPSENLRSSTRHLFLRGDINHTAKSTGTFS